MVSPARNIAFKVLQRVIQEKANSSILLDSYFLREQPSKIDRNLATQLVYGTLRWQNRLDYVIAQFSHIPLNKITVSLLIILRIALYQRLFLDRIPESAAVSEAVDLAKKVGHRGHASFANALLREVCRRRSEIVFPDAEQSEIDYLVYTLSHPRWLVERWLSRWGYNTTVEMLKANNREVPLYLRINTLKTSNKNLQKILIEEGIEVEESPFLKDCFKVQKGHVWGSKSMKQGYFYVMDAASQIVAALLAPEDNQFILDSCAAPGGKTFCIACSINQQGKIIANDLHWSRIKELEKNLTKLGISRAFIVQSNFELHPPFQAIFDRILLDAPCSALGRIRRSPEIKWNRDPEEISKNAQKQLRLLEMVSKVLKPGGLLLYSVCSLEQEENEEVIYNFLKKNNNFRQISPLQSIPSEMREFVDSDNFIRIVPQKHDMDGFFVALLTAA